MRYMDIGIYAPVVDMSVGEAGSTTRKRIKNDLLAPPPRI